MGLHDRPYWKDDTGAEPEGGVVRSLAFGLSKPSKAVKWLLIINLAAFLLQQVLLLGFKIDLSEWFGATVGGFWQIWRYLTFQFLHAPNTLWHIGLNMLGLYILGTPLEQFWGTRRFLRFYLSCGAVAGLAYVILGAIFSIPPSYPLIGASGGVYGILLACAVLFPHMKLILVLFSVPIRLAAVIIFGGMILLTLHSLKGGGWRPGEEAMDFWSSVAHLGGAVMAAMWLWVIPRFGGAAQGIVRRANRGAWQRKMQRRQADQADIDRILDKIRLEGLASLTRKEKHTLKQATLRQQREERDISRL
jgi:membrane associated rhomboid family serine protease